MAKSRKKALKAARNDTNVKNHGEMSVSARIQIKNFAMSPALAFCQH